ncbi:hypothetical protein IP92_05751 [Pseudoduganella flava]|uniref:DUF2793 domain-containing protein n=1 Tax=Pseudoduganella flava TaxID=871742 RepID=A0A562P9F1_9BURK|nr:hypothetical protein [Pseudoduganella flava]QGZ42716.1 hypothetical protein GO485_29235 [Pseudoduganella flava]TWI41031.1 hypothetical protein IP92_05751 [Pseudoduganella flava]
MNPNKSLYTAGYAKGAVPTNPAELPRFLDAELARIEALLKLLRTNAMDPTYEAPTRPRAGMLVYAPGAPYWDPGAGEGIYLYTSGGTWMKL